MFFETAETAISYEHVAGKNQTKEKTVLFTFLLIADMP